MLIVQNGFGYAHLDFEATKTDGVVAKLPANTPRPTSNLELQTFDGGFIKAFLGGSDIRCEGLKVGQRYVVDLMGFFQ